MRLRQLLNTLLVILVPLSASAQSDLRVGPLYEAMGFPEVIEIMRDEGIVYGVELGEDMLEPRDMEAWSETVGGIYEEERIALLVAQELEDGLREVDITPLVAFFSAPRGEKIVSLEISARRALMDPDIEADAIDQFARMAKARDPRVDQLREFAEVNNLIQENVIGGLNANFAFFAAMRDGGAMPGDPGDGELLELVLAGEPEVRADTEEWLFSYLAMAYSPLSDEDLDAYIALSKTAEGQALNAAIFEAFDVMFVDISRRLGEGIARQLSQQDL
ncbi:MAG: hypothetical protein HUJ27_06025 [Rhodobacteraceae bacterium]|nr:hypothetical protein [Paracoccaceae bacterium]